MISLTAMFIEFFNANRILVMVTSKYSVRK